MDGVLMWVIQGLTGIVVAFGLNILKNVNEQIKDVYMEVEKLSKKLEGYKETLDQVELPNVGVKVCDRIQDVHDQKHVLVDKSIEYFHTQTESLAGKAERNKESILQIYGELDLILQEVQNLRRHTGA